MNEKEKHIHTIYISHYRGIKAGLYVLSSEHGIRRAKSFLSLILYVLGGGGIYMMGFRKLTSFCGSLHIGFRWLRVLALFPFFYILGVRW